MLSDLWRDPYHDVHELLTYSLMDALRHLPLEIPVILVNEVGGGEQNHRMYKSVWKNGYTREQSTNCR